MQYLNIYSNLVHGNSSLLLKIQDCCFIHTIFDIGHCAHVSHRTWEALTAIFIWGCWKKYFPDSKWKFPFDYLSFIEKHTKFPKIIKVRLFFEPLVFDRLKLGTMFRPFIIQTHFPKKVLGCIFLLCVFLLTWCIVHNLFHLWVVVKLIFLIY